jgi:hypothetical protein
MQDPMQDFLDLHIIQPNSAYERKSLPVGPANSGVGQSKTAKLKADRPFSSS